ncbi:MAG: phosphatase PAP2 family protein [Bacteroidetes bacterium]|nr:phosphatase PAP2 family protein [Bacteroidota bacterium]
MIEKLKYWDTELFLFLNGKHNDFWDFVMYWISHKLVWVPVYLFLVYLIIRLYKKNALWVILCVFAVVGISDFISVNLFKNVFERLRPCHEPSLLEIVHLVKNKCGGSFGFYSSHASNHFALSTVLILFLRKNAHVFWLLLLGGWAAVVSYSRIYLGVHYPGDVLAGAMAGVLIGWSGFKLLKLAKPGINQ